MADTASDVSASAPTPRSLRLLDDVLATRRIRTVFQPVVDLDTGAVVGYEALSRGPADTPLERPQPLFAAAGAGALGQLAELDWLCRHRALETALDAGMRSPTTLLLNVEPAVADAAVPPATRTLVERARAQLHVVVEFTERALLRDPAQLLTAARRIRELGWGIALDDVGAHPASLALVPVLRPDVIKLDLTLVRRHPSSAVAEIVTAVGAERERAGTRLLAEGIENDAHVTTARSAGATLGQGRRFGQPGPLPRQLDEDLPRPITHAAPVDDQATPFTIASAACRPRRSTPPLLLAVAHHLEREAARLGTPGMIVSTIQHRRRLTEATRRRYQALASRLTFVGLLGAGVPPAPAPGVRGGDIPVGDPLTGEWNVAVLSSHFAAALSARELRAGDGDGDARQFAFVVSYQRDLVVRLVQHLLARIAPA